MPMSIIEQPVSPPGCCFICGATSANNRKWFFDLDKQAEWWGNIYFCSECFNHISLIAKYGNVTIYQDRIHELERIVSELSNKVGVYESALFSIQSVSIVPNSFTDDRLVGVALDSTLTVELTPASERESGTSEQTDDSFMDGIREPSTDSESSLELKL